MQEALDNKSAVIAILIMAAITYLLRALPFWIFGKRNADPPKALIYLGNALPYSVIALLVVYCFRNLTFDDPSSGIAMLIAGAVVAILQSWKHNNMLSIFGGTGLYMILLYLL